VFARTKEIINQTIISLSVLPGCYDGSSKLPQSLLVGRGGGGMTSTLVVLPLTLPLTLPLPRVSPEPLRPPSAAAAAAVVSMPLLALSNMPVVALAMPASLSVVVLFVLLTFVQLLLLLLWPPLGCCSAIVRLLPPVPALLS
jgi:hypothetical protein